MKRTAIALSVGLAAGLPAAALAQAGHDAHHPARQLQEQAAPPASPTMPMSGMPEQYRTMMQAMPAECMNAMQQMMQGGMMHGAADASKAAETAPADGNVPDFTRAYVDAMDAMHGPMMEGVMADDSDTAFVRSMIPHHRGAIDMARIVQQHGDDPQTRAWAEQIIAAQEREIAEMQAWLKEKAHPGAIDFGQTGGTVWSADEGGSSVSAIDLGTGTVTTIPIPVAPHNVDLTPDARFLLAVGTPAGGNHGDGHDHAGSDTAGLLVMLDPQDLSTPPATVEVGAHPAHVVADRQGRAFVSLSGSNEVVVVDLAQGAAARVKTGAYPHGLRLSPDGAELYVANVEDESVSVLDTASLTEAARIPVGTAPVQVGFTPDGSQVYVSLRDENRVAVIGTATREVTGRIEVGPNPIQMIATPDGKQIYVANQGTEAAPNDTVSVIDTATSEVAGTLKTGPGAHGVSASADGAFVFVTNIADDSVSVINVARQEVLGSVPVGDRPNGIVYGSSS